MYISLTKGQRLSFKQFLSGGSTVTTISQEFLKDQLKCLRLYHCFNEADDQEMCNTIDEADSFHDKAIHLCGKTLTSSDMICISLFLTSSFNRVWVKLDLQSCHIQDKGLKTLYRGLCHSDVIIDHLWLFNNDLTTHSSFLISELTVKCKVKELWITGNYTIGEDKQLYSMLTNNANVLEQLYMDYTKLSSRAATNLFESLKDNNKLKELYIGSNDITDDACDAITTALQKNSCLVKLSMHHNPVSSEAILTIVRCFVGNNTLQLVGLPMCPQDIQKEIKSLQKVVNKNRKSQGHHVELDIVYKVFYK